MGTGTAPASSAVRNDGWQLAAAAIRRRVPPRAETEPQPWRLRILHSFRAFFSNPYLSAETTLVLALPEQATMF